MSEQDIARLGFDPDWTAEQALDAGIDGPRSPLHKWAAWIELQEYQKAYEAGHKESLLSAIAACALHGLPMPDWMADSYLLSFQEWVTFRKPGLDEAFEVALPKGKHVNKLRERRILEAAIPLKVQEIHKSYGRPIDEILFEDVGREFNVSGGKAREIYYGSWLYRVFQKNR